MTFLNEMKLSIAAQSRNEAFCRSVVGAFCTQLNPTLEQIEDVKTAVSEAVTNCVVHAYGGSQEGLVEIFCGLTEGGVVIEITDFGKGIDDVDKAMQPFFTTSLGGERSGMGFTVMKAFADEVSVESTKGKTTVKLVKNFSDKAD